MRQLLPNIYSRRPHYFGYLCAQFLAHIVLGFAFLLANFNFESDLWVWFGWAPGIRCFGIVKLTLAVMIVYGAYHSCSALSKAVLFSVALHWTTSALFLCAFVAPSVTHVGLEWSATRLILSGLFASLGVYSIVNYWSSNTQEFTIRGDL